MTHHGSKRMAGVLFAVLAALLVAAIALVPHAKAQTTPDRRNVATGEEANGFPIWYQDARGKRVYQCLSRQLLCGIENPNAIDEVIYWAGEASMPVGRPDAQGRQGEARLVMAVEGASDPDAGGTATTGSVILVRADGLRANRVYKVSFPYGTFQVRTNGQGEFPRNGKTLRERGCDIEAGQTCNFHLPLRSHLFRNLLAWDPDVRPAAPRGYMGNPEVPHKVVGSLVKNRAGKPQNYFRIEGPNAGGLRKDIKQVNRFSITGQRFRNTRMNQASPEGG